MRFFWLMAGLSLTPFALEPTLLAQAPPDVRTIVVPQSRLWCGPSNAEGLYPTNQLRQGESVQVVEELPSGWLAVRPPTGSFSWINKRYLQQVSPRYKNYVVAFEGHPVPVLIGSILKAERPTKIGVKLPRGAQVRVISDRVITDEEGTWLPIEPPEGEVRYIRREDVTQPARKNTAGDAKSTAAVPPADGDTLWRDAEKAERAGKLADAIKLYLLARDANLAVNPARADAAEQRANWLKQANQGNQAPRGSYYYPERDGRAGPSRSEGRVYPLPTEHAGSSAVRLIGPCPTGAPVGQLISTRVPAPCGGPSQGGGYGPPVIGRLGSPARTIDRERIYLLTSVRTGNPILYVRAQPGVDLSSYVHHTVEVQGSTTFRGELRTDLMTVARIREVE